MFKQIITLIFTTLVIIYAQDPTILQNSLITTTEEAERVLAPIHISEALPIVLFEGLLNETTTSTSTSTYELHYPQDIIEALTVKRKMVNGTRFSRRDSQTQIFFCPKENSEDTCLVPQNYGNLKQLKCSKEPIPIAKELPHIKCSLDLENTTHLMVYDICHSEPPYRYKKSEIGLYGVCYNKKKRKVLYASHYIRFPKLLKSKLLHREHNFSYSFSDSELQIAKYWAIKNSLDSESDPFVTANKPLYRVQNLMPSEDMAFGSWKKPVYKFVNTDLQHRELFPFWNEINEKVTANAILMHDIDFNLWHYVVTGVLDLTAFEARREGQIYNMWVKMIILKKHKQTLQGVVILMNNFLDSPDGGFLSKLFQNRIVEYCPNDLCADDIKNRVENIGGRMRCCPITKFFFEFIGQITNPNLPVLQIPDLIKIQA